MSDLVGTPNCWFSHAQAQILAQPLLNCISKKVGFLCSCMFKLYYSCLINLFQDIAVYSASNSINMIFGTDQGVHLLKHVH